MELNLAGGTYVIAISGGVDSMVLLDLLLQQTDLKLTVAHFDHGIRPDSAADRKFVQGLAKTHVLPFIYETASLGPGASEAVARQARYDFLRKAKQSSGAIAIVTAHHQDDLIETAILNMLRGTSRKGLTALKDQPDIIRPLLKIPKTELVKYAQQHALSWREDPSNQDTSYLRNYVRHQIVPRFSPGDRAKLIKILEELSLTNQELDSALSQLLNASATNTIERLWFNQLPHDLAKEMMAAWLRRNNVRDFDSKGLERLVRAAKIAAGGKRFPVLKDVTLEVQRDYLALVRQER